LLPLLFSIRCAAAAAMLVYQLSLIFAIDIITLSPLRCRHAAIIAAAPHEFSLLIYARYAIATSRHAAFHC